MTRHLFKLVWNRKRSNALMILEICVSFLVVFVVATLGLFFFDNYRHPLGFEWKQAWNVRVDADPIAVRWETSEPVPPIELDRNQLEQVLVNVLKNAQESIGED